MAMAMEERGVLETALRKLQWGASQRHWSVDVTAEECAALLQEHSATRVLTYLAVPYSHPERDIRIARFVEANKAAGVLMKRGDIVFSPISHTHPIAEDCDLPKGWDFWNAFDRAYLNASRLLVVLCIDGWRESVGVKAELEIAQELGIPVEYMRIDGAFAMFGDEAPE